VSELVLRVEAEQLVDPVLQREPGRHEVGIREDGPTDPGTRHDGELGGDAFQSSVVERQQLPMVVRAHGDAVPVGEPRSDLNVGSEHLGEASSGNDALSPDPTASEVDLQITKEVLDVRADRARRTEAGVLPPLLGRDERSLPSFPIWRIEGRHLGKPEHDAGIEGRRAHAGGSTDLLLEERLVGPAAGAIDHRAEQSESFVGVAEVLARRPEKAIALGREVRHQALVGVDRWMVGVHPDAARDLRVVRRVPRDTPA